MVKRYNWGHITKDEIEKILVLTILSILLGLILLLLAYGRRSDTIYIGYFQNKYILILNVIPVLTLIYLFAGLSGNCFLAYLFGSGFFLLLSLINFYKISFRDDPFIFSDLLLVSEAKEMILNGNYNLFVNFRITVVMVFWGLSCMIAFLINRGGIRKIRVVVLMVAGLLGVFFFFVYGNRNLYNSVGSNTVWLPTEYVISRGGIYPFLHSIYNAAEHPPEKYNKENVLEMLSEYNDFNIPSNKKVNIIAIMREAYVDFSRFDINGLDCSEYAVYHQLKEESYNGELITNIFSGGTIDTERCFLTGDYKLKPYTQNVNSYIWYLKGQGYTVEGCHPYMQSMYNRININKYLGFEKYRYLENDFEYLSHLSYPEDSVLLSEIYQDYKNREITKPYFSFSINVQSHGPYSTDSYREGISNKEYLNGDYTNECKYAMNNYMNITMEQDRELRNLVDQLSADSEPIILVVFSDHLPWMGNGNIFYSEMGIEFQTNTEKGFRDYYTTEYFIWANSPAKQMLKNNFQGKGPTISPCYLMNEIFKQCGWKGPAYMQAMSSLEDIFPVVTTNGGYIVDGQFTYAIPENRKKDMLDLESLDYYWRNNFFYGGTGRDMTHN